MSNKEQLIQEIEQSPDYLIEEVLNFLLFIKMRLEQRQDTLNSSENSQDSTDNPILSMIDDITAQIPPEDFKKLPLDLSKNLDHYLYGSPKIDK